MKSSSLNATKQLRTDDEFTQSEAKNSALIRCTWFDLWPYRFLFPPHWPLNSGKCYRPKRSLTFCVPGHVTLRHLATSHRTCHAIVSWRSTLTCSSPSVTWIKLENESETKHSTWRHRRPDCQSRHSLVWIDQWQMVYLLYWLIDVLQNNHKILILEE